MYRIVLDERERFAEFAKTRIPHIDSWGEWYQAIGLERDGEPIAAVVYNYYSRCDIAMHVAAVPGRRWMTRAYLQAVFQYPFLQLKVNRVSGYVPAKNWDVQRFDEHLGFIREGVMRKALEDDDVIVYGMLKEECRFL